MFAAGGLPALERILGRERHLLVRPTGEKVFPELYREFVKVPAIRQFQLTQKTLEQIEMKLAVARPLTPDEQSEIRNLVNEQLGYPFELPIVYVDEIPREASGKYQDYRSELDRDDIGLR